MIVGLGIDLVDINRMKLDIAKEGFIQRVFTPTEITACASIKNSAECFAGKFAAKEACMKAIGAGIRQGVWFTDIEVLNQPSGQPFLKFNTVKDELATLSNKNILVSITHTRSLAVAVVLIESLDHIS